MTDLSITEIPDSLEGHYAGPVTRLLAATADGFIAFFSYNLLLSITVFFWNALVNREFDAPVHVAVAWGLGFTGWLIFYNGVCWAVWWKTPGKALLGTRVVERDGSDLRPRHAWMRALVYPFSSAFVGVGLVGIVVGRERRALHDVAAGTTVVYAWNARSARWRMSALRNRELRQAGRSPDGAREAG